MKELGIFGGITSRLATLKNGVWAQEKISKAEQINRVSLQRVLTRVNSRCCYRETDKKTYMDYVKTL